MNIGINDLTMNPSGFVVLADYVPHIIQEIRYHSSYNFIGERIDGYEEPVAIICKEAARRLKTVANEMMVQGYRLKVFDAYRPACAVKHFVLWGIDVQMVFQQVIVRSRLKRCICIILNMKMTRTL